uniref:NACHT LRR and PYD domain-containing protein n=1 Tax=Pygocentrus nattereri TaxID=42514 RepID=A0A3B4CHK2_PYGNA
MDLTDIFKKENPSPEKSINLFHCLNELNDHSLVKEVQTYVNARGYSRLSGTSLSPTQWSALVFVLLNSEEELDDFDLLKYDPSEEGLLMLLPVVKACQKAILCECNLTEKSCEILSSALSSSSSSLRELDLSYNELQDSGVELLSAGLENPSCKLEKLKKVNHCISKKVLHLKTCSVLSRKYSRSLKEISLLSNCGLTEKGCAALASALSSKTSSLRHLDLSYNETLQDSGMMMLSAGLGNLHCKVETLRLRWCNITEKGCAVLASALSSNSSHLKKLNLSYNKLQDSGVKLLSAGLKNPHCKLETVSLYNCSITDEGFAALALALKSNPSSQLRELDVIGNQPGESGVKLFSDLLEDPCCKLEKLQ